MHPLVGIASIHLRSQGYGVKVTQGVDGLVKPDEAGNLVMGNLWRDLKLSHSQSRSWVQAGKLGLIVI